MTKTLMQWDEACVRFLSGFGGDQAWLVIVSGGLTTLLILTMFVPVTTKPLRCVPAFAQLIGLVLLIGLSMTLSNVLKESIARPRPNTSTEVASTRQHSPYGMPSSHAVLLGLSAGVLGARWQKTSIRLSVALLTIAIGMVRVVKGMHYPTDVLVGWMLGLAVGWLGWLSLTWVLCQRTGSGGSQSVP